MTDTKKRKPRSFNHEDQGLAQTVRGWFKLNNWAMSFPQTWAKAAGNEKGPHTSQIQYLTRQKLEPKPAFFIALAEFNRAVAENDLDAIDDERVKLLLQVGDALKHPDGQPYDAQDLFGIYIGKLPVPAQCIDIEGELQEHFEVWQQAIAEMFKNTCLEAMTDGRGTWLKLEPKLQGHETQLCQEAVLGLLKPEADQIKDLFAGDVPQMLRKAINEVCSDANGLCGTVVGTQEAIREEIAAARLLGV